VSSIYYSSANQNFETEDLLKRFKKQKKSSSGNNKENHSVVWKTPMMRKSDMISPNFNFKEMSKKPSAKVEEHKSSKFSLSKAVKPRKSPKTLSMKPLQRSHSSKPVQLQKNSSIDSQCSEKQSLLPFRPYLNRRPRALSRASSLSSNGKPPFDVLTPL